MTLQSIAEAEDDELLEYVTAADAGLTRLEARRLDDHLPHHGPAGPARWREWYWSRLEMGEWLPSLSEADGCLACGRDSGHEGEW